MADKMNLNTASEAELKGVTGVDDECARRIVEERERRGGFNSVEELDEMKGFGEQAIRHLKEQATV